MSVTRSGVTVMNEFPVYVARSLNCFIPLRSSADSTRVIWVELAIENVPPVSVKVCEPAGLENVMERGLKLLARTVSEKVMLTIPLFRSRVNERSCGGVMSGVKVVTRSPLPPRMGTTGLLLMS